MIPKEILRKVKQIEIRTRGVVNNLFGGEYHTVFKGRGMTFSEVREYQPGDDIRLIDWNVTARNSSPFLKIYEEERELTVYLLVDISNSGQFGSINKLKKEFAAEIASVLGFSAINNNDKVGLILFSSEIEKYLSPKKGKSHILRIIRELLYTVPRKNDTSIQIALEYFLKVSSRRCVVFLISDFLDDSYWSSLKVANRKHDLIGIKISDPFEKSFPDSGVLKVKDAETGSSFWIDTSSKKEMKELKNEMKETEINLKRKVKKIGFDLISLSTGEDFVEPLIKFFRSRERRL